MSIGKLDNSSASAAALKPELEEQEGSATRGDADWFKAALQKTEPTEAAGASPSR